jgi:hypothetical protein
MFAHRATTRGAAATRMARSPLPSLAFGTNDENEKDSADRRAGWKRGN